MSQEDLPRRLEAYGDTRITVSRVALTAEDVADRALPSFSADTKRGDPRWRWYRTRYGRRCWELDALSPVVLRQRVTDAIEAEIEWGAWRRCARAEKTERESLAAIIGLWNGTKKGTISGQATE